MPILIQNPQHDHEDREDKSKQEEGKAGVQPPPYSESTDVEADTVAILPEGFSSSFTDKAIRARFVRKVYGILLSQLTLTLAIISIFLFVPAIKGFYCSRTFVTADGIEHCGAVSDNGIILYWVSYALFFTTYIALMCCEPVRRKSPGNMIALLAFTLALSVWVSSIAIFHDVYWVMISIGMTAAICLALTVFSFQTKWDFTGWGPYLCAASWILFIFGIVSIIFYVKGMPIMNLVYSGFLGLLFSMFLVMDTQQILGGKKYSISPEEHVYAAVQLYLDIIYIFLAILRFGRR